MSRSIKAVRSSKKKSSSKKQKKGGGAAFSDAETASTTDLTEQSSPLVEKSARKQQRKEARNQQQPTSLWHDLNIMFNGCCGAIEAVDAIKEDEDKDLFADDDDNFISKIGHSIMHKAGFAPPVKIIRCTQEDDDDSVITTPKVLVELAKQYDQERFWANNAEPHDDTDGTVATNRTALSTMTSMSKRLIPNLSLSGRGSRASKSVKTMGSSKKQSKKVKSRSSDGRYEI